MVQKYCDFLVRYAALLYLDDGTDIGRTAAGGINEDIVFETEGCTFSTDGADNTVWSIIREGARRLTIHFINLRGNDGQWNQAKQQPAAVEHLKLHLRLDRPISGIYAASPDGASLQAQPLPVTYRRTPQGRIYTAEISRLEYWTAVWVTMEE